MILPSQPCGVCRKPLPVALSVRSSPALICVKNPSLFRGATLGKSLRLRLTCPHASYDLLYPIRGHDPGWVRNRFGFLGERQSRGDIYGRWVYGDFWGLSYVDRFSIAKGQAPVTPKRPRDPNQLPLKLMSWFRPFDDPRRSKRERGIYRRIRGSEMQLAPTRFHSGAVKWPENDLQSLQYSRVKNCANGP